MKKVLIAEDEDNIRNGLKVIIDWNALGCKICGEAANGREALEKIEKLAPDIVLLDIKMPELTGLEVLESLKRKKRRIKSTGGGCRRLC